LDDICHTARSAALIRHNQNATTEVDARIAATAFRLRTASGLAYAPTAGISRRLSALPSPRPLSVADVFGRPPTCVYADMNRLKSNEAIRRREFVPRDPCRTNQR
jgi:hypothetical protein